MRDLASHFRVGIGVDLPRLHGRSLRLDPQNVLRIRLVPNHDIDQRQKLGHAFPGKVLRSGPLTPLPQLLAEVQIAGNLDSSLRGLRHQFGALPGTHSR